MDLVPPNVHTLQEVIQHLERMYDFLKWWGRFECQYMEWQEVDAPESPGPHRARIYALESSDGRTQLVAKFDTGNPIRIVIEQQTTDDLSEGNSNVFFSNERALSAVSDTIDERIAAVTITTTDDVPEGTNNLYYTDERVDDRVDALVTDGVGITTTYDDPNGTLTFAVKQQTHETDASESHDVTGTDTVNQSDLEAALDALGSKINAILVKLETAEILASA
ncbi:MAG: hypothetical protein ACFFCW_00395 [Candidatus Hodarchaeota archaeon]